MKNSAKFLQKSDKWEENGEFAESAFCRWRMALFDWKLSEFCDNDAALTFILKENDVETSDVCSLYFPFLGLSTRLTENTTTL